MKKILSILIILSIVFANACGGVSDNTTSVPTTSNTLINDVDNFIDDNCLTIGYTQEFANANPFFSTSFADNDAVVMTTVFLLAFDNEGNVIKHGIEGESVSIDGYEAIYKGICDINDVLNADGTVTYEITLSNNLSFSDGEKLNIDDVIFSMYVLADPSYDGPYTFNSLPILGMDEYRATSKKLFEIILDDHVRNIASSKHYAEEQKQFVLSAFNTAGINYVEKITDYITENNSDYGIESVADAALLQGYSLPDNATKTDFWNAIKERNKFNLDDINNEINQFDFVELFNAELSSRKDEFNGEIAIENTVNGIKGINRIDDYKLTITLENKVSDIYKILSIPIAPLHYYGDETNFNYDLNRFGFSKGQLAKIKSNFLPMGAGPFECVSLKSDAVEFERNDAYYLGAPNIKRIKFITKNEDELVKAISLGECDIAETILSKKIQEELTNVNFGNLSGDAITVYRSSDYGYGYVGISADLIKVDEGDSESSKALRRAFAILFSAYCEAAVSKTLGEDAYISLPIGNNCWVASNIELPPMYSQDINGNNLYDEEMSADDKFPIIISAAKEYFLKAGYNFDAETGKMLGQKTVFDIAIYSTENEVHPVYSAIVAVKRELDKIGITLNINSFSNNVEFVEKLNNKCFEMWIASYSIRSEDLSLYQRYHSAGQNRYAIFDPFFDSLIEKFYASNTKLEKQNVYLDIVSCLEEYAVEIPIYENRDITIISSRYKDSDIIGDYPFARWIDNIHKIKIS